MSKYESARIKDMVLFIDQLMTHLYPPFKKLNGAKKKKYILEFFRFVGLVKLKKHKRSGDVWKIGDKLAEAVKCGRPRGGQHYESFVRGCVGPSGLRTDWFNFVIGLITIFSREYKLFFEWLLIESKTIKLGNKILPSHGLTGKSKDDAISFTLAVLMVIYVKQCSRHYMSGLKRKDRKQRRRTKEIIKPSSVTEQFSTEAMTKSLAAGSTPEGSSTVGLPKILGTVDENAQSEPLSNA